MTTDATTQLPASGSDYSKLSKEIKDAGLLGRRPGYYIARITLTSLLFAAGWAMFFVVGRSWYTLIVAVFLAVMTTQMAFIGHDTGHRQILASKTASHRLNLWLGNFLLGMSAGWWDDKHNRHHANPNHLEKDPDVNVGPIAFTPGQAAERGRFRRQLARHQAWTFFPLLLLEGYALHVHSFGAMFDSSVKSGKRVMESIMLLLHIALYLTAVFAVLSPLQGVVFIAVHQGLWGVYMGLSFAPNHKGMPYSEETESDFLRRQVLTSRNIRGGWFTNWALGSLNYQIEHHLFPSMPSVNLARAQAIVRQFCDEHNVGYTETSAAGSYRAVIRHLRSVSASI